MSHGYLDSSLYVAKLKNQLNHSFAFRLICLYLKIQTMRTRHQQVRISIDFNPQSEFDDYHLNFEHRLWIISQRLEGLEIKEIIQQWSFDRRPPSVSAKHDLIKKVKETGSIQDKPGRGGVETKDSPQNRAAVMGYVEKYRCVSVRELDPTPLRFSSSF